MAPSEFVVHPPDVRAELEQNVAGICYAVFQGPRCENRKSALLLAAFLGAQELWQATISLPELLARRAGRPMRKSDDRGEVTQSYAIPGELYALAYTPPGGGLFIVSAGCIAPEDPIPSAGLLTTIPSRPHNKTFFAAEYVPTADSLTILSDFQATPFQAIVKTLITNGKALLWDNVHQQLPLDPHLHGYVTHLWLDVVSQPPTWDFRNRHDYFCDTSRHAEQIKRRGYATNPYAWEEGPYDLTRYETVTPGLGELRANGVAVPLTEYGNFLHNRFQPSSSS